MHHFIKTKMPNHLPMILRTLQPFKEEMAEAVVELIFNWYWLMDGLTAEGY